MNAHVRGSRNVNIFNEVPFRGQWVRKQRRKTRARFLDALVIRLRGPIAANSAILAMGGRERPTRPRMARQKPPRPSIAGPARKPFPL